MHPKFLRRLGPAERAVARKRRQVVVEDLTLPLTGPVTITVVRTLIPAAASTSSVPSSSSSSTTTQSSTSTSTSTTTSTSITPISTLPPSTSSPSPSPSSPSLSSTTIISSTPSPSPSTSIQPVAGATASSSPLSFGAIVGIVIGCVVALVIAIFLCTLCTRKRYQRDRARLRGLWANSKEAGPGLPPIMGGFEPKPYAFTPAATVNEQIAEVNRSTMATFVPVPVPVPVVQVMPPPAPYSNAPSTFASPTPTVSNLPVYSQGTQLNSPLSTTVVCTFLPSMPDELAINIGETIKVLAEYDDGWVLGMNASGEQGMIPLECLERGASSRGSNGSGGSGGGLGVPQDKEVRRSRRVSSLDPSAKALKAYQ